jgi:hypothetical protein
MSKRKLVRTANLDGGSTDAEEGADQQEAWAIAAELIADLGASEAVAWADDYMLGLHEKSDWRGMQRWGIVASALSELASANVH